MSPCQRAPCLLKAVPGAHLQIQSLWVIAALTSSERRCSVIILQHLGYTELQERPPRFEYEGLGPVYMHERPPRGSTGVPLSDWEPDDHYLEFISQRNNTWQRARPATSDALVPSRRSSHAIPRIATSHHMPSPHLVRQARTGRHNMRPVSSPAHRLSPSQMHLQDVSFRFENVAHDSQLLNSRSNASPQVRSEAPNHNEPHSTS